MTRELKTWVSLCCGLDATSCRAMTGHFPPVSRMGGKRAYANHVLEIVGWSTWTCRPSRWLMVDADPAIVAFWVAAFDGHLPAVARVIREAPLDGEELWRAWSTDAVPTDPIERLARWIVLQKGNFSGKPLTWGETWGGVAGYGDVGTGFGVASDDGVADRVGRFWDGVAGFKTLSANVTSPGVSHVMKRCIGANVGAFPLISGAAVALDLTTEAPPFAAGDLVTIDPPYRGTTGYKGCLSRERVVELAALADAAGCMVLVHEAEPVLTGGPWRHVELQRRHGVNQRTWSKQRREVATINFEPHGQGSLF